MVDPLIDDACSDLSRVERYEDESTVATTAERQTSVAVIDASPDSIRLLLDLARRALRARASAILRTEEQAGALDATLTNAIVVCGVAAGSLVVRDEAHRQWSNEDRAMLRDFAELLATDIERAGEIERLRAKLPDAATDAADQTRDVAGSPIDMAAAEAPVSTDAEPFNILLADDLDLNRKLISDMLSIDGYAVDSVADGAAAVEAVKLKSYDLVLMDMIMPGMDGVEAARAIRSLPAPTCDVPIVALTAHSFREQLDNCLDAGMNDTLIKPMSFDALSAAVATWVRPRQNAA